MTARTGRRTPYQNESNVTQYIEARKGLCGQQLVEQLGLILDEGSSVLELGMGPGTDLLLLSQSYKAVGSDNSVWFLERFRSKKAGIEVLDLDAVSLKTSRTFDCIFSNKVLHHLSFEDLETSLFRQSKVLGSGGIMFHSFWIGDEETVVEGLRFTKYRPGRIVELFSVYGEVIATGTYAELNLSDSFFVAARI